MRLQSSRRAFRRVPTALRTALLVLAAGSGVVGEPASAGVNYIYVGASAATCTASSPAQALAMAWATAGADEIRLTRTLIYTNVNLYVHDWDLDDTGMLIVSGGWDDCLDLSSSGETVLSGSPEQVVVEVAESGASSTGIFVVLRDLELTGANTGVSVGGLSATTPATVRLESSVVHGNEHGAAASQGARLEIDGATVVRDNAAVTPGGLFGGGLVCIDPGTRISLAGTVRDNSVAEGFPWAGGGAYLSDQCRLDLEPGAVIEGNSAGGGGGVHVAAGSTLAGGGIGPLEVRISGNTASGGGGVLVRGTGSVATLQNVRIDGNRAIEGAGVHIESGGLVELRRAPAGDCPDAPRCLTLSGNLLDDAGEGFGSAAFVLNGGEFRMYQGFIEGNGGFSDYGQLIMTYTHDNRVDLEGVQIWNNRTRSVFLISGFSELVGGFLTAAGNSYLDSGSGSYLDSFAAHADNHSSIRLYTSIWQDHQAFLESDGSEVHVDCLLLETTAGTTSAGANMLGFDPRFRNAAIGDLSLRPDSPAIDACDTFLYSPIHADYDLDGRGYDSATKPDILGPFDRGADESPLLFASGFETGTYTGWSSTQP